jgi:hypothetical protein
MDRTEQHVGNPTKEVVSQPFHAYAHANYTDSKNYVNNNSFDPERFIQDATMPFLQEATHAAVLSGVSDYKRDNPDTELDTVRYLQDSNHHAVLSNASSKNHRTPIDEVLDLADLPVHLRTAKIAALAPMSGPERTGEFGEVYLDGTLSVQATTNTADTSTYKRNEYDNEILLERNRPQPSIVSNAVGHGTKAEQQVSRDFALKQKISAGGFDPVPQIPSFDRAQNVQSQDSRKREMYQRAAQNMHGRFTQPAPY